MKTRSPGWGKAERTRPDAHRTNRKAPKLGRERKTKHQGYQQPASQQRPKEHRRQRPTREPTRESRRPELRGPHATPSHTSTDSRRGTNSHQGQPTSTDNGRHGSRQHRHGHPGKASLEPHNTTPAARRQHSGPRAGEQTSGDGRGKPSDSGKPTERARRRAHGKPRSTKATRRPGQSRHGR